MTTSCSEEPRYPAAAEDLSSGRDGPSTLSAESLRSNEIDTVARDLVFPRDVRGEHACLPAPFQPELPCPSDRLSNRHMLLPERPSLQNSSVLPTECAAIPTSDERRRRGRRRWRRRRRRRRRRWRGERCLVSSAYIKAAAGFVRYFRG